MLPDRPPFDRPPIRAKSRWPRLLIILIVVAGLGTGGYFAWRHFGPGVRPSGVLVAPRRPVPTVAPVLADDPDAFTISPDHIKALTPDEARAANLNLPVSTLPIQPARPFFAPTTNLDDYARALDCMTAAVYYVGAFESPQGQAAIAQVVLNRMRHPAYPNTVCGVVFQGQERTTGCQFTFTCNGAMTRLPVPLVWARAKAVAGAALNGYVARNVGMATHYHADYVVPYWAERLAKIGQLGTHIFYRWQGSWGTPPAFTNRYVGGEPVIAKMAPVASLLAVGEPITAPVVAPVALPPLPELEPVAPRIAPSHPGPLQPAPVVVTPAPSATPPPAEKPRVNAAPPVEDPLAPRTRPRNSDRDRRIPLPNF
jgi:spore germination cell wall hydrolase CwlJ-like protein